MDCNVGAQLGRQFTKDALMMQQQQGAMHADPSIAQRDALMSGVMMGPEVNANDWLASHAEQQMHAARMQNEMEKAFMAGAGPVHVAPPPATADQAAMMQGGMMAGPQAMMAATMAMSMPMMVPRTQYQPTNFLGAVTAPVTTAQPTSAVEDQAWSTQLGEQNWAQDYTNAPVFSLDGQEAQTVTEKTKNSEFYGFMDKIRNKELLIDEEKGEVVAGPGPEQPTDADSAYLQDWAAAEGLDMPASYFRSPPPDAHLANMDDYAKELDLADNDAEEWAKQYAESQRNTFNNTDYPFEPNNPHLYHDDPFHEGQNLLALGNLSEAALAFEAACQKDNDHFEAWRLLGRTQSENEKDSLAILALNNARRLRPKDLDTHAKLAVAYFNEHNSEYSMDCLKMWLTSHPDYEHVGNMTIEPDADLDLDLCDGFFADPTRFRELTTLYGAALEMNPNDYMLHLNLGVLHNIARDFDAAAESFRQCVRLKPDAPELWNKLGASLANGSREREALDAYNRALDLNPGYVRTMYNIAVAYNNLEQPTQAAKHMVRAIAVQEGGTKPVGEGSRMATRFMWDFLRMTLNISNRPDLVELAQHEDIEPFVKEFGLEGLV